MKPPDTPRRKPRRVPRKSPLRSVKVVCRKGALGLGTNIAAGLHDLSEAGARLVVKEELRQGQEVTVAFDGQCQGRPVELAGIVSWVRPHAEGAWLIGVAFDKTLPWASLRQLTQVG